MKIYSAILHTGGKSLEEIKGSEKEWNYSDEEAQIIKEYMDAWDGIEICVMEVENRFAYLSHADQQDEEVMNAFYFMEQDPVFGSYQDDREEFERAWKEGEYQAAGTVAFTAEDVELIGEIGDPEEQKTNEIMVYIEALPAAGMAQDNEGNKESCYIHLGFTMKRYVSIAKARELYEKSKYELLDQAAAFLKTDKANLKLITKEEYDANTDEENGINTQCEGEPEEEKE